MAFREISNKPGLTDQELAQKINALATIAQPGEFTDLVQREFTRDEAQRAQQFLQANPQPTAMYA